MKAAPTMAVKELNKRALTDICTRTAPRPNRFWNGNSD